MKPIIKYLICAAVAVSIAVIAVVIFIGSSAAVTAFDKTQKNSYGYSMTVDYAFGDSRNAYVVFSSPAVPPAGLKVHLLNPMHSRIITVRTHAVSEKTAATIRMFILNVYPQLTMASITRGSLSAQRQNIPILITL